ncbi:MAG: pilus assembly protein PilM [Candidatus Omnitrophica bacterium]|nr:pilus assembly protein PilM [Candidatus Omnitrophota bacterium]
MINFNLSLQPITSIYVAAREVYLAQVKGVLLGPRLVKFGKTEIQVQAQADESAKRQAIVQALRRVVQENNIKTKNVVTALPGKDVLIRYFQMPQIPKQEWETAIKFEAKRYIPFKIEELMWDFHVVLPKGKDAKMDVTFVAVKREVAQKYIALLEQAGLKPSILESAPFSLLRLFILSNQLAKGKPTTIVDIDYGMADINIVKDKICYLTRDVSLPLEEEVVFDSLLNEIRMSLDYYEKLFPAEAIGKILLCGEVELKDWDRKLAQELKLSVEKADFAKALKVKKVLPPLNMAVAVGLALRGLTKAATEVDLYQVHEVKPEAVTVKEDLRFSAKLRQAVFRAVALSCAGLLILHLVMYRRIAEENKKLERVISLRPKITLPIASFSYPELEKVKKELENKLSILNLIVDNRIFWTNKFNELPKAIPPGVWLTELSISDKLAGGNKVSRSLVIKGVAYHEDPVQEIGRVTKFVSNLKDSEVFSRGFKEIELSSMKSGELKKMPVKDFVISCLK